MRLLLSGVQCESTMHDGQLGCVGMEVEWCLEIGEDEDQHGCQCHLQVHEGTLTLLQPCHSLKRFHLQEPIQHKLVVVIAWPKNACTLVVLLGHTMSWTALTFSGSTAMLSQCTRCLRKGSLVLQKLHLDGLMNMLAFLS
jgi:hypothetical protein